MLQHNWFLKNSVFFLFQLCYNACIVYNGIRIVEKKYWYIPVPSHRFSYHARDWIFQTAIDQLTKMHANAKMIHFNVIFYVCLVVYGFWANKPITFSPPLLWKTESRLLDCALCFHCKIKYPSYSIYSLTISESFTIFSLKEFFLLIFTRFMSNSNLEDCHEDC